MRLCLSLSFLVFVDWLLCVGRVVSFVVGWFVVGSWLFVVRFWFLLGARCLVFGAWWRFDVGCLSLVVARCLLVFG